MKRSQAQKVLQHLKHHGPLTPLQALDLYGCFRLAARVAELRQAGAPIRCEMVERGGKRFAEYRIA